MKFTPGTWQAEHLCRAILMSQQNLLEALTELNEAAEQYLEKQSVNTINRLSAALWHARAAIAKAEGR